MSGENELVEKKEENGEILGAQAGALTPVLGDDQLAVYEMVAKNADRMVQAHKTVWSVLLKITKPRDWCVFGKEKKTTAELGHGGAMRYAAFLGISFTNWSAEKVTGTDELGPFYRWEYECEEVAPVRDSILKYCRGVVDRIPRMDINPEVHGDLETEYVSFLRQLESE